VLFDVVHSHLTTLFVSQYQSAALICGQEGSWTGNTENHTDLMWHKALLVKRSKVQSDYNT